MVTKTHKLNEKQIDDIVHQTGEDARNAVLVVSVLVNVFVLTTWLVAEVSTKHATALASYFKP